MGSPSAEKDREFILQHQDSFANAFPPVWDQIHNQRSGLVQNKEGLFIFASINPMQSISQKLPEINSLVVPSLQDSSHLESTNRNWKIISQIRTARLNSGLVNYVKSQLFVFIFIAPFLLLVSVYISKYFWKKTSG